MLRTLGLMCELEREATQPLPSLQELREQLDPAVATRVGAYLRAGAVIVDMMEACFDPLDKSVWLPGGSGLQSDGTWVWRQDLHHYVDRYRVGLPSEFLEWVERDPAGEEVADVDTDAALAAVARARFGGNS